MRNYAKSLIFLLSIIIFAAGCNRGSLGNGSKSGKITQTKKEKKSMSHPKVIIETSMGNIVVELDAEKAPVTVKNFLTYVDEGHYNGTIFHRVVSGFVIQGGGFTPDMKEKGGLHAPIKNEASNGLSNLRGTIAMARTMDPNSARAQFYINLKDNLMLDPRPGSAGYAVFGKVTEGMDVVDKIAAVPVHNVGHYQNVPTEPVVIKAIRRAD